MHLRVLVVNYTNVCYYLTELLITCETIKPNWHGSSDTVAILDKYLGKYLSVEVLTKMFIKNYQGGC